MAQTGNFSPIQLYSSSTPGNAPAVGNLVNSTLGSELAINIVDGKLFYKDSGGSVQVIGWKTVPTTAGGTGLTSWTAGQLPYYASGTTLSQLNIGNSGYFLTSSGTAPQWTDPTTIAVTSISFGTTGLTPSTATKGAVTVAGTLVVGNGGTGLTSLTANYIPYGNGTSAFNSSSSLQFNGTNLGIGGAPNTWYSNRQGIQISGSVPSLVLGNSTSEINFNNYINASGNNIYTSSSYAGVINYNNQVAGGWAWLNSASGTSGSTATMSTQVAIDNAGNLLVGGITSTPFSSTRSTFKNSTSGAYPLTLITNDKGQYIQLSASSGTALYFDTSAGGVNAGSITVSGGTTLYNVTSDRRLKTNINPLTNSGALIDALLPRVYTWSYDNSTAMGFVLDEYQNVFSDAVTGEPNAVDSNGKPIYQQGDFSTGAQIAVIVAELQSLRARLKAANIA